MHPLFLQGLQGAFGNDGAEGEVGPPGPPGPAGTNVSVSCLCYEHSDLISVYLSSTVQASLTLAFPEF